MKNIILLVSILGVAACGDNLNGLRPDAREINDGAPVPDSPPGTPDANVPLPDAGASTVTVTAGACPNTPDHTMEGITGQVWAFDAGALPPGPVGADIDITIAAGETVEWSTIGSHSWTSDSTGGAMSFDSGALGAEACLTFTAAGGPEDFHCKQHATMVGSITVTP